MRVKTALRSMGFICVLTSAFFVLPSLVQASSFAVNIDQRFMSDTIFGDATGFSKSFHPEFQIVGGFYKLDYGLEPVMSLAYLTDSANTCAVLEDGVTCDPEPVISLDQISYQIFSFWQWVEMDWLVEGIFFHDSLFPATD